MNKSENVFYAIVALVMIAVAVVGIFGARWFNATTVAVTIHNPQPASCALSQRARMGLGLVAGRLTNEWHGQWLRRAGNV